MAKLDKRRLGERGAASVGAGRNQPRTRIPWTALRQVLIVGVVALQIAAVFGESTLFPSHPGTMSPKMVQRHTKRLNSLADHVLLTSIFLALSAVFAGLTIGIMCMDTFTLEIVAESGPEPDRTYASHILPVRRKGHHTLCTLIISNMALNVLIVQEIAKITDLYNAIRAETSPPLTTEAGDAADTRAAILGFILSTGFILIFTEIIPMSICKSKHSLRIAAAGLGFVQVAMVVTFPVAVPLGWLLDRLVPHGVGQVYDRNELKKLMRIHYEEHSEKSGLVRSEVQLLLAAMNFHEHYVKDIMTPISSTTCVSADDEITPDLLERLWMEGRSRLPVTEENGKYAGIILLKDLIAVNLNVTPPTTIKSFMVDHPRSFAIVNANTSLPEMLTFFQGGKTHMALVYSDTEEGVSGGDGKDDQKGDELESTRKSDAPLGGSKYFMSNLSLATSDKGDTAEKTTRASRSRRARTVNYMQHRIVGVVTLEDVVEELIEDEIYDEYDRLDEDNEAIAAETITMSNSAMFSRQFVRPPPEPAQLPRVNFSSYYVHEVADVALTDAQKWAMAYFIVRSVPCFYFWRAGYVKMLIDISGDVQMRPVYQPPELESNSKDVPHMRSPCSNSASDIFPMRDSLKGIHEVQQISHHAFVSGAEKPEYVLYEHGVPSSFFTLILGGAADMLVGADRFPTQLRTFEFIGEAALTKSFYVPDFSAVVKTPTRLIRISRSDYESILAHQLNAQLPGQNVIISPGEERQGRSYPSSPVSMLGGNSPASVSGFGVRDTKNKRNTETDCLLDCNKQGKPPLAAPKKTTSSDSYGTFAKKPNRH